MFIFKLKTKIKLIGTLAFLLLLVAGFVFQQKSLQAASASNFNFTAYIVDQSGQAISDGQYDVRFGLYNKNRDQIDPYPSESDPRIWQETQQIFIFQGVLNADLGLNNAFPADIDFSSGDYFIGVRIGMDSEMAPRKKLSAVPFANNAASLAGAKAGNQKGNIPLVTNTGLDAAILKNINQVGTIGSGTWQGAAIADKYIANSLTGKTYNSLTLTAKTEGFSIAGGSTSKTLTVSQDASLDQDLLTTSSPTFKGLTLLNSLSVLNGGTGLNAYAKGDLLVADGVASLTRLAIGAADQVLRSDGTTAGWETLTKDDVGLSNVENIALTTWSGFDSLSTVGTIETGAWQASIIAPNYGGTGLDGSNAQNGQILIGNGTGGFSLNNLTVGAGLSITNSSGLINLTNTGVTSLAGTANQVVVSASGGAVTLSLPQNIATSSNVAFSALTLTNPLKVASGGTGLSTYASGDLIYYDSGETLARLNKGSDGQVLSLLGGLPVWSSSSPAASHGLLSLQHSDTNNLASVSRGALVTGQGASPKWSALALGTTGYVLKSTGTDAVWSVDNDTTYSASGTLLSLSGTVFSLKEGTLTSGRLCSYDGTNLVCDTDSTSVGHAALSIGTAGNGLSLTGQAISLALASASVPGALSATDWDTFNKKQNPLSGTGFVKIAGTTISYDNTTYVVGTPWTAMGYITASSLDTFTNKSGNISQWSNDVGYITSGGTSASATTLEGLTATIINLNSVTGLLGTAAFTASSSYQTASTSLASLANLSYTAPAFVKMTSANTFALDTNAYLTSNQAITLTGDVAGSGTTAITTTIGNNKVNGTMLALGSDAQGDLMYYNGTDWVRLAAGTAGQFLKTQGALANPVWSADNNTTYSTSGTLLSLAGTTFSLKEGILTSGKLCTFDGTNLVCNTDSGSVGHSAMTLSGTVDYLTAVGQQITLNQIDLTTDVAGVLPIANGGTGRSTGPTSNGQLLIGSGSSYALSTLTASTGISVANAAGSITISNTGVISLTGTTNQVNVAAVGGDITLSLPQSIATNSDVQFKSLTLSDVLTVAYGGTGLSSVSQNSILYASGANVLSALTPGANQLLVTNASGVPNFSNLSADNFAQYALLAGRTGGQTLIGGSAVTDVLKLQGTSGNGTSTSPAIQLLTGNNGGTTAMTVLNNGNVGIGTTTPGGLFQVGGATPTILATSDGKVAINSTNTSAGTFFVNGSAIANVFYIGATGYARWNSTATLSTIGMWGGSDYNQILAITNTGNVGIGTTGPSSKLHVNGTANGTDSLVTISNTTGTGRGLFIDSSSSTNVGFLVQTPLSTDLSTGKVFGGITGESYGRFMFYSDGKYGIGAGTTDRDIFISRHSANTLKVSSDGSSGSGNLVVTGDVGIGTNSPIVKLHVSDGNALAASLSSAITATGAVTTTKQASITALGGAVASNSASERVVFNMVRARGTLGTPTAVQADDYLGDLLAGGYDGSQLNYGGGVFFFADGNASGGNTPTRISFVTGNNSSDRQERLTIKSTGNVGIGTTSPGAALQIGTITDSFYSIQPGKAIVVGTNYSLSDTQRGTLDLTSTYRPLDAAIGMGPSLTFTQQTSKYVAGYEKTVGAIKSYLTQNNNIDETSALGFYVHDGTSLGERVTILGSGNVGIGTTAPATKLYVLSTAATGIYSKASTNTNSILTGFENGNGTLYTGKIGSTANDLFTNGIAYANVFGSNGTGPIQFGVSSTAYMTILTGGNVGIGTTSPGTKLQVAPAAGYDAPTLGVASGAFSVLGGTNLYGLYEGTSNSGYSWLQAMRNDTATAYSLLLNPSGGNVGIGTTSPSARLTVQGAGATTGETLKLQNSAGTDIFKVLDNGTTILRGSAVTDAPTLGSEFLTGGAWTSTDWTGDNTTGWVHASGPTTALSYSLAAVNGTKYQIAYTVTRSAGSVTIAFGGQSTAGITATGTFGPTATSTGNLVVTPTSDFVGSIVLSIKAITAISTPLFALQDSGGTARIEMRGSNVSGNTFIGNGVGRYNTTGYNNSAQGVNALYYNTTGSNNSAQGYQALYSNTTGSNNSAQGMYALYYNTTGVNNSVQGASALYSNTTGVNNSAQGYAALYSNTTGSQNSAQGMYALYSNTTGSYNSAQGLQALYSNTTGSYNSAQGVNAGRYLADGSTGRTTGNNGLYLGYNSKASADGTDNEIVIGASAIGLGSNTVVLGNDSIVTTALRGNVGIGTTSPTSKLQVVQSGNAVADNYGMRIDNTATNSTIDGINKYGLRISSTGTWSSVGGVNYGLYVDAPTDGTTNVSAMFTGTSAGNNISMLASGYEMQFSRGGNNYLTASNANGGLSFNTGGANTRLNLDSAGNANFNAGQLYIQKATGNIGIGTTSPASMLSLFGATNEMRLSYDSSNYTTLATNSIGELQIKGGNVYDASLILGSNDTQNTAIIFDNNSNATDFYAGVDTDDNGKFKIGLLDNDAFLTISNLGKMGIGVSSPAEMLQIGSTVNPGNVRIDSGWLCVDSDGTCSMGTPSAGSIYSTNLATTGADYAEYFYTKDTNLQAGEAVCLDQSVENGVKRCQNNGDNNIMGIVSSNPSIVGNKAHANDQNYKIIGMLGQVKGKVSAENGDIKVGDSLTAGLIPGQMRKANAGESTVGIALENFANNKGTIAILIARRNQSLTVEKVTQAVTENIAALNIKDQVDALVAQASNVLNSQLSTQASALLGLQLQITDAKAIADQLQAQIDLLKTQNQTITEFITILDPTKLIYKDTLGNLDLTQGKLTAKDLEVLGTLEAKDIEAKNSLKSQSLQLGSQVSGAGIIKAGELTSAKILTTQVKPGVKLYITPKGSTNGKMLYYDEADIEDSVSFTVKIDAPALEKDAEFNWLIVK